MELLQSFAPDVWLLYNKELEAFKGQLDQELEALRKEAELVRSLPGRRACVCVFPSPTRPHRHPCPPPPPQQINLGRKTKQDEVAPRLANLVRKREETLYTNLELQKACAMLRGEIKKLKTEVEAGGGKAMEEEEEEEEEEDDL